MVIPTPLFLNNEVKNNTWISNEQEIHLNDYPTLVACYKDWTIVKSLNASPEGCYMGKWWSNVYLPSLSQHKLLTDNFWDNIYSKMAIINHESQWNSNAVWVHKYWKDCGLLQIRDIYGGCKMNDQQQMDWLKVKIENSKARPVCKKYTWEKLIRCVFMKHNGQVRIYKEYDNKLMVLMNWYEKNFNSLTTL